MGSITIVKKIKLVHSNCMVLVKIGNFYHVFSKDAYIISYLLNYRIKLMENVPCCAFPVVSLRKVEAILENNKIDYLIVDKRNNYEVEEQQWNKKDNRYERVFKKAYISVSYTIRIQKIYDQLMQEKDKENIVEKLEKIERILKK